MASVLIVTGPPGAGKSTVTRLLAERAERSVRIEGDQFFHFVVSSFVPPWQEESRSQNAVVLQALAASTCVYAQGGYLVVLDGIVGPWFLSTFRDALRPGGVPTHYVVLRPSEATTAARAKGRVGGLTEEEPLRSMYHAFLHLDRASPLVRGHYEAHVLDTSAEDPTQTADRIWNLFQAGQLLLDWLPE